MSWLYCTRSALLSLTLVASLTSYNLIGSENLQLSPSHTAQASQNSDLEALSAHQLQLLANQTVISYHLAQAELDLAKRWYVFSRMLNTALSDSQELQKAVATLASLNRAATHREAVLKTWEVYTRYVESHSDAPVEQALENFKLSVQKAIEYHLANYSKGNAPDLDALKAALESSYRSLNLSSTAARNIANEDNSSCQEINQSCLIHLDAVHSLANMVERQAGNLLIRGTHLKLETTFAILSITISCLKEYYKTLYCQLLKKNVDDRFLTIEFDPERLIAHPHLQSLLPACL